jgi:F-type H+-transporting ATPase subunit c
MDVMALSEVTQGLVMLQVQGDIEAGLKLVGVGIAAGTAVIGPGAGMGYLIGQTIASIHRQPEAFDQTRTLMFLGIGLVEAFALYGIVFALLIAFVLA